MIAEQIRRHFNAEGVGSADLPRLLGLAKSHLGRAGNKEVALLQALQEVFNRFAPRANCQEELRQGFAAMRKRLLTDQRELAESRLMRKILALAKGRRLLGLGDVWVYFSFLLRWLEAAMAGLGALEAMNTAAVLFLSAGPADLFDVFDFFEYWLGHAALVDSLDSRLVKHWNLFHRAMWDVMKDDPDLWALWEAWHGSAERVRPLRQEKGG